MPCEREERKERLTGGVRGKKKKRKRFGSELGRGNEREGRWAWLKRKKWAKGHWRCSLPFNHLIKWEQRKSNRMKRKERNKTYKNMF